MYTISMKRILLLLILFFVLSAYNVFAQQGSFSVSASVPPQASNFQFTAATTYDPKVSPVTQSTTLEYVITYGASSSAGFDVPATITADWRSSDAMTNVRILDYVPGSASNAYGNTPPVIDLENRTITWDIPVLPAGKTNQTVKFDLKTNSNYTGDGEIKFTVKATMNNQYVTMPQQTVTRVYKYKKDSGGSTTTTTSTPTTTTTTAPPPAAPVQPALPQITNASFTSISDGNATLLIDTATPVKARISYGTSSRSLSSSLTTAEYALRTLLTLDDLLPNTNYYLRLLLTDQEGRERTSETFTFRTAERSTPPDLEENIIVLTSNGNILVSDIQRANAAYQIALLTPDSDYEFTYAMRNKIALNSIEAVVRNKVLGITDQVYAQAPQTITIPMREKSPSVYVASLRTLSPGTFEVSVRITDENGNITEQKVTELKVIPHLSVIDKETNEPISDSRVFFTRYNGTTGQYEPLSQELFKNIPNPSYTDISGLVRVNLPQGKYQAHLSAFGYDPTTVDFTLGTNPGEEFPQVLLEKNQANLVNYIQYYLTALGDIFTNIQIVTSNLAFSVRFFNLLATFILIVTIGITFVLFSIRTRVYLRHILPFFTHHVKTITQKHPLGTFCATITDEDGRRIKGALISVLDDATGELLTSIASNTIGICYLFNPKEHKNLKLLIIKQGYQPKTVAVESDIANTPEGLTIVLKRGHKPSNAALAGTWSLVEAVAGRFFEVSLFVSFLLELFFLSIYGFTKTLPFFVLSIFNLILWIFYQREKQLRKVFKKPS